MNCICHVDSSAGLARVQTTVQTSCGLWAARTFEQSHSHPRSVGSSTTFMPLRGT